MPRYQITAPDGATYEVNAPDGATEQDAIAYVKAQSSAKPAPQPGPESLPMTGPKALVGDAVDVRGANVAPSLVGPDLGWGKSLAVGAGRSVDRLIAGLQQSYYQATDNKEALDKLAAEQKFKDAAYKPLTNRQPVKMGVGEELPAAIVSTPFTGGGGALKSIGVGFLTGALPEILSYGNGGDRLTHALSKGAAGATGAGLGVGITKLLQPVSPAGRISDTALNAADNLGVDLSAGQVTQSPMLQGVENWLARTPGYSKPMQERAAANQLAINRAAAKAIGQRADDVGEGTLAAAKQAIGAEYSRLNQLASPDAGGNAFMGALQNVEAANLARGPYARAAITREVDKGLDLAAGGRVPGAVYNEIRSTLGDNAQRAFKAGDDTLGRALKEIQGGLDTAAKESLNTADQAALDLVRKQYGAYKVLTKGQVAEAGNVSAARLASALRQSMPDAFRRGATGSELQDIGRLGEAVKAFANPTSGATPTMQMLFGNPLTGIPTAAANYATGALYMSKPMQAYLASALLSPPVERAMLRASVPAGLLAAGAATGQ